MRLATGAQIRGRARSGVGGRVGRARFRERGLRDLDLAVMDVLLNEQYQATATTKTVMTVTLAKAVAGGVVLGLYSRLTGIECSLETSRFALRFT